jgi:hypothetical protein
MSHKCPGPSCEQRVADHMLMCRPHWYQVPRALRDDVWLTWRNGQGAGWADHNAAMRAAIDALKAGRP